MFWQCVSMILMGWAVLATVLAALRGQDAREARADRDRYYAKWLQALGKEHTDRPPTGLLSVFDSDLQEQE